MAWQSTGTYRQGPESDELKILKMGNKTGEVLEEQRDSSPSTNFVVRAVLLM
jgi:hypothetical protein